MCFYLFDVHFFSRFALRFGRGLDIDHGFLSGFYFKKMSDFGGVFGLDKFGDNLVWHVKYDVR